MPAPPQLGAGLAPHAEVVRRQRSTGSRLRDASRPTHPRCSGSPVPATKESPRKHTRRSLAIAVQLSRARLGAYGFDPRLPRGSSVVVGDAIRLPLRSSVLIRRDSSGRPSECRRDSSPRRGRACDAWR